MKVVELVVAGILALAGIRSLVRWLGRDFDASSATEQVLYALHATSRVGGWLALAGFFAGYALVSDPMRFGWYILVPIALAGIQLLTGLLLSRSPVPPARGSDREASNPAGDGETLSP